LPPAAGHQLIAVSILLGVVVGVTEELLWRGVYVRLFPDNLWLNTIYPSVMFGSRSSSRLSSARS
jgi:membrane protease YdiL (CAAX protease family)